MFEASKPSTPVTVDLLDGVYRPGVLNESILDPGVDSGVIATVEGVLTGGEAVVEILPEEGRGGENRLPLVERGVGGVDVSLAASLILFSH